MSLLHSLLKAKSSSSRPRQYEVSETTQAQENYTLLAEGLTSGIFSFKTSGQSPWEPAGQCLFQTLHYSILKPQVKTGL